MDESSQHLPPDLQARLQQVFDAVDKLNQGDPEMRARYESASKGQTLDKGKWHWEGDYPAELDPERGSTHIAMYFAWAVDNHHVSSKFAGEAIIARFRSREVNLLELMQWFDDVLAPDMLTDEAAAFSARYYGGEEEPIYIEDYSNLLAANLPTPYHVEPTFENYERIKPMIQERFETWQANAGRL